MTITTPGPLPRDARIYIAGHRGLVGSALWRRLNNEGFTRLCGAPSTEVDLRDRGQVMAWFSREQPEVVVLAAAQVGGIMANSSYPADFLSDNLRIQVNVLDAAWQHGVQRLMFLGSSCIYPKHAVQPIAESSLMTGPLEPTNDAYAIAKIAGVMQVQALRRQYGVHYISAMPTNLYGPGDNFDAMNSHVLPGLLRRIHEAKRDDAASVTIWGSGNPRREFMHVDDLASALLFLLERYDDDAPINVGVGTDLSILELATTIAEIVGWHGRFTLDPTKPDGTPRKLLDVSRLTSLGWTSHISLTAGLTSTYDWYLQNQGALRR